MRTCFFLQLKGGRVIRRYDCELLLRLLLFLFARSTRVAVLVRRGSMCGKLGRWGPGRRASKIIRSLHISKRYLADRAVRGSECSLRTISRRSQSQIRSSECIQQLRQPQVHVRCRRSFTSPPRTALGSSSSSNISPAASSRCCLASGYLQRRQVTPPLRACHSIPVPASSLVTSLRI